MDTPTSLSISDLFPTTSDGIRKDSQNTSEYSSETSSTSDYSTTAANDAKTNEGKETFVDKILQMICCRSDKNDGNPEERTPPASIRQMFRFASRKDTVYIVFGTFLAIVIGALQLAVCLLGGKLDNILIKTKNPIGDHKFLDDSFQIVYIYVGFGIGMLILSYMQTYLLQTACVSIVSRIRRSFLTSVLSQDSEWFDRTNAGTLTSKLADNVDRIQDGLGDKWGLIVRGASMFTTSCVIAFVIDWKTAFVMIGLVPLSALTMALTAKIAERPTQRMMTASSNAGAIAEEALLNVKTVAACNGQKTMVKRYKDQLEMGLKWAVRVAMVEGCLEGIMFFELYIFVAAGFLYGILGRWNGSISEPGHVFIVVNTVCFGAYFVGILGPHLNVLLKARVSAAIIYGIIDRKPEIDIDIGEKIDKMEGRIEFKNVQFQYPTRDTPILKGISFNISPGQAVAFVGHSGCGKSTSIGLITALYKVNSGQVEIDGKSIDTYSIRSLRKHIGIVQQEPSLFTGTISENISMGRRMTQEEIVEAAKMAYAHEFIVKLEKGYGTLIGNGGVSLSGGQKQRISIARAIVTKPTILLMDEATSALDSHSERIVQRALNKASRGRTTIMIAHRLSSLREVDKIYVFDNGKIVEEGTHAELLSIGGKYSSLARAQEMLPEAVTKEDEDMPSVAMKRSVAFHHKPMPSSYRSSFERRSKTSGTSAVFSAVSEEIVKNPYWSSTSWASLFNFYRDSLKECPWKIIIAQVASLARGLELPFYCFFQKIAYDALAATQETYKTYLIQTCVCFAALGVFCWIIITLASVFAGWSSECAVNAFRIRILDRLLLKDASYFDDPATSGPVCVTALAQQTPNCRAALDNRFCIFSSDLSALIVCLALCFGYCWQMGLLALGICGVLLTILVVLAYFVQKGSAEQLDEDTTAEIAIEMTEHARTIQLMGIEKYFLDKYAARQNVVKGITKKINIFQSLTFAFTQAFVFFSEAAGFSIGLHLIYTGQAKADDVFMAALCVSFCGWALFFMQPSFNDVTRAAGACRALYRLIEGPTRELDEGETPTIDGSFSVEHVDFSYPTRPKQKVASNLNLFANPGEAIALVGASGCGKSTVISLLERFYAQNSGKVIIGGGAISTLSLSHLRNNIALVGQEPVLFRGSIMDNICLGVDNVTLEEVRAVCKLANAAHFIEAFPKGYDTDVGERGRGLSGGQKQRIAIARALVRRPKLLLMDEATSALDTHSEKIVQEALNDAKQGRTSVTIAHRLATIQNADRIYFIENGSVVEYGTHKELLEADGRYANMVRLQQIDLN